MNGPPSFEEIKRKSIAEVAYEDLEESILGGSATPGTRPTETQIADRMGISRSPAREVLRLLEADGLIDVGPNRSACVKQLSAKELWEVCTARQLTAALVARRATADDVRGLEAALERLLTLAEADDYSGTVKAGFEVHHSIWEASGAIDRTMNARPMPGISSDPCTARVKDDHNGHLAVHLIHSHKED